jgi:lysophospholipase L1-like esterase
MLLDRFDTDVLAYEPDYVFMMIGVNDAWRHFDGSKFSQTLIYPEDSGKNMEQMILKTLEAGATPVIISPYFLDNNHEDPMRKMVDEINAEYKALAAKYNIGYIDVQTVFDEYLKTGSCYILSGDRVHPKSVGISIIARTIYNHPDFRVILHD